MKWFVKCLCNYVNFRGRATRREFWYFVLFEFLILLVVGSLIGLFGGGSRPAYYAAVAVVALLYLPHLAVMVRRLHDTDRSGWWAAGYVAMTAAGRIRFAGAEASSAEIVAALIAVIYLVFLLFFLLDGGDAGDNDYGADPHVDAGKPART